MYARIAGCALFWVLCASAGERMTISVCNFAQVPRDVVVSAEHTVSLIFGSLKIGILWVESPRVWTPGEQCRSPRLVLLLQPASPKRDWMARTFVAEGNSSIYADIYYHSLRNHAAVRTGVISSDDLLAYVMAHELGHLLLGTDHSNGGIMSECWTIKQIRMMRRRMLLFHESECAGMRRALRSRADELARICQAQQLSAALKPRREPAPIPVSKSVSEQTGSAVRAGRP